jgi:hypothetical protein
VGFFTAANALLSHDGVTVAEAIGVEPTESDMRQFLTLAILAIVLVGGVSVYRGILTVPADEPCISCG